MRERQEDRRMKRTRQLLSGALIDLLVEKRYDAITVQHIIDRAGVGRSTFYSHYRDKEDLLVSSFEKALDSFSTFMNVDRGTVQIPSSLEFFKHAQENHRLFKALTRGRVIDLLFEKGQDFWSRKLEEQIEKALAEGRQSAVPLPILANYVAGTFLTLLKWWLNNGMCYSPEQMDQMFRQLVAPSVEAAIGGPVA